MKTTVFAENHRNARNARTDRLGRLSVFLLLAGLALFSMSFKLGDLAKAGMKGAKEAGLAEAGIQAGSKVLVKGCKSAKLKECKLLGDSFTQFAKKKEGKAQTKGQAFLEANGEEKKEAILSMVDQSAQMAGEYAQPVQEYAAFLRQRAEGVAGEAATAAQGVAGEAATAAQGVGQEIQGAVSEQAQAVEQGAQNAVKEATKDNKSKKDKKSKKGKKDKKKKKKD